MLTAVAPIKLLSASRAETVGYLTLACGVAPHNRPRATTKRGGRSLGAFDACRRGAGTLSATTAVRTTACGSVRATWPQTLPTWAVSDRRAAPLCARAIRGWVLGWVLVGLLTRG